MHLSVLVTIPVSILSAMIDNGKTIVLPIAHLANQTLPGQPDATCSHVNTFASCHDLLSCHHQAFDLFPAHGDTALNITISFSVSEQDYNLLATFNVFPFPVVEAQPPARQ